MTVLILSEASDIHAQAVMEALGQRGSQVELLDLAEFPTRLALSMEFRKNNRRFELTRRSGGSLDLSSIKSVWWRRRSVCRLGCRPFTDNSHYQKQIQPFLAVDARPLDQCPFARFVSRA
jgi:hypothetical protein